MASRTTSSSSTSACRTDRQTPQAASRPFTAPGDPGGIECGQNTYGPTGRNAVGSGHPGSVRAPVPFKSIGNAVPMAVAWGAGERALHTLSRRAMPSDLVKRVISQCADDAAPSADVA